MENYGFLGPTCVLKLDLQCCKECPLKVEKKLKQINGVTSIHISTRKGLVTVSGVEDVSTIIKAIEELGRKAELWKYERGPKLDDPNFTDIHRSKSRHKNRKHIPDDDHSGSDTDASNSHDGNFHDHHFSRARPGVHPPHMAMHGPGGYFPGPGPQYPPARPYGYEGIPAMGYGRPSPSAYNYYRPPPPRPPTYPRELKVNDGPDGNSIVHTFNDLNVDGCTIL